MADDLDNFFAKKAAKRGKKVIVQDMDSLAKRLEKAVRHQVQIDHDREEEERINKDRMQTVESQQATTEDSEWLDAQQESVVDLTAGGIRDLDIEEINEEEKFVNNEQVEKHKTWLVSETALGEKKLNADGDESTSADGEPVKAEEAVIVAPVVEEKKPEVKAKYVNPMLRKSVAGSTAAQAEPNLKDAEEFPSLMAADNISKKELEKRKLKALRAKELEEKEKQRCKEYEEKERELMERRKKDRDSMGMQSETSPAARPPSTKHEKEPSAVDSKPKYVPPHLRSQS